VEWVPSWVGVLGDKRQHCVSSREVPPCISSVPIPYRSLSTQAYLRGFPGVRASSFRKWYAPQFGKTRVISGERSLMIVMAATKFLPFNHLTSVG